MAAEPKHYPLPKFEYGLTSPWSSPATERKNEMSPTEQLQTEWENLQRPRIVCLCGSTRFYDAFQRANYEETMKGHIVLSVGFYPHCQTRAHGEEVGCTDEQKRALDALHLRKIDLADEVLVLNVGGYIGSSTRGEIEHACKAGKPIRYLEPTAAVITSTVPVENKDK